MHQVLHILPHLPPRIDGVGDYALRLAGEIASFGVQSQFLACSGSSTSAPDAQVLPHRDARQLTRTLTDQQPEAILLHYSGYGFSRCGTPLWLVRGLRNYCVRQKVPLAVFFHEVWSTSAPWRTPFWFQPLQRALVRTLQNFSSLELTSTLRMQEMLGPAAVLSPIPSPLPAATPLERRGSFPLELVCFGQLQNRVRSLQAHSALLRQLSAAGELRAINLVGKDSREQSEDALLASALAGPARLRVHGEQPPSAIAATLGQADCLLSFYPSDLLTKSSTAMAAFASGCPVLVPVRAPLDSFSPPPPFLTCDGSAESLNQLRQAIRAGALNTTAADACRWHETHASWEIAGKRVARGLLPLFPRKELNPAAALPAHA